MATRDGASWWRTVLRLPGQILFLAVVAFVVLMFVNQELAQTVLFYVVSTMWAVISPFAASFIAIGFVIWGLLILLGQVFRPKKKKKDS